MTRKEFRETVFERDDDQCLVPWCLRDAQDAHHIIERDLWEDGGYIPENGASVCHKHHKHAEQNKIPPQAFWRWLGIEDPPLPQDIDSIHVDKWGEPFEQPPWKQYREEIKYPSTRHLPFSHIGDDDDTYHREVDCFLETPLVITVKMDGSNAMLVSDSEEPVRARNGKHADKAHFDMAKQMYWENNLYERIPDHIQVFGEWLYAKHSIHYGCDCDANCDDVGPALRDYFQVFGAYDTRYDLWISWFEVERLATGLDLPTVPVVGRRSFQRETEFYDKVLNHAVEQVANGHEGIVVRSRYPFHYDQMDRRLGKYVRENHVEDDADHWSHRPTVQNVLEEE